MRVAAHGGGGGVHAPQLPVQNVELMAPRTMHMGDQKDSKQMKQYSKVYSRRRFDAHVQGWLADGAGADTATCCAGALATLPQLLWERVQQQLV